MAPQARLFSNKMLIRLIIPLVIEQTLAILVGMCDGIMVSSVGEAAISGVSLVDMINNVVLVLFAALATGGAVVTSQFLGAREQGRARQSVGQLVLMSLLFGVAAMVICVVLAAQMLHLLFGSIEQDVFEAGVLYFRVTALAFPFIALYNAGAAVFRSLGDSKISMKVSILMNLLNVVGNAICIYGLKMNVLGVALPTLLSRVVGAAVILYLVAKPDVELQLRLRDLRRVQWDIMHRILKIGIPSAMENSVFQFGRVLVVSMIALFGTYQTSANAVANTLNGVGCIIGQAMGLALVTVVGQCVGAGDEEQTKYYTRKLMVWCYISQGIGNALIVIFHKPLVGLYSSLSPETIELAYTLVAVHCAAAIVLWPTSFVLPNALRAANDVRFTMLVSIGSMAVCRLGLSWIFCVQMGMGAIGVWIAMIVDWICRDTFFLLRIRSGIWLTKYEA